MRIDALAPRRCSSCPRGHGGALGPPPGRHDAPPRSHSPVRTINPVPHPFASHGASDAYVGRHGATGSGEPTVS